MAHWPKQAKTSFSGPEGWLPSDSSSCEVHVLVAIGGLQHVCVLTPPLTSNLCGRRWLVPLLSSGPGGKGAPPKILVSASKHAIDSANIHQQARTWPLQRPKRTNTQSRRTLDSSGLNIARPLLESNLEAARLCRFGTSMITDPEEASPHFPSLQHLDILSLDRAQPGATRAAEGPSPR